MKEFTVQTPSIKTKIKSYFIYGNFPYASISKQNTRVAKLEEEEDGSGNEVNRGFQPQLCF